MSEYVAVASMIYTMAHVRILLRPYHGAFKGSNPYWLGGDEKRQMGLPRRTQLL